MNTEVFRNLVAQSERQLAETRQRVQDTEAEHARLLQEVGGDTQGLEGKRAAVDEAAREAASQLAELRSQEKEVKSEAQKQNAIISELVKDTAGMLDAAKLITTRVRNLDQGLANKRQAAALDAQSFRRFAQTPGEDQKNQGRGNHRLRMARSSVSLTETLYGADDMARHFRCRNLSDYFASAKVNSEAKLRAGWKEVTVADDYDRDADYTPMTQSCEASPEVRVIIVSASEKPVSFGTRVKMLSVMHDKHPAEAVALGGSYDGDVEDDAALKAALRKHVPQIPKDAKLTRFVDFNYTGPRGEGSDVTFPSTKHVYYVCDLVGGEGFNINKAAVFETKQVAIEEEVEMEDSEAAEEEAKDGEEKPKEAEAGEAEEKKDEGVEEKEEEAKEAKEGEEAAAEQPPKKKTKTVTRLADVEVKNPTWSPALLPISKALDVHSRDGTGLLLASYELKLAAALLEILTRKSYARRVLTTLESHSEKKRKRADEAADSADVLSALREEGQEPGKLRRTTVSTEVVDYKQLEEFHFFSRKGKVYPQVLIDGLVGLNQPDLSFRRVGELLDDLGLGEEEFVPYAERLQDHQVVRNMEVDGSTAFDLQLFPQH
eukprot:TRINITY_DN21008_c3_g1_i1.p1 TRINITY_DN21008_c3_g1~~TRINITY_DN21008_c3_g1_i1.p1  ORF type:complete len:623 (+),score=301.82 TRINITY_DN21008_c3_g1_i1:62-1870(+)